MKKMAQIIALAFVIDYPHRVSITHPDSCIQYIHSTKVQNPRRNS